MDYTATIDLLHSKITLAGAQNEPGLYVHAVHVPPASACAVVPVHKKRKNREM